MPGGGGADDVPKTVLEHAHAAKILISKLYLYYYTEISLFMSEDKTYSRLNGIGCKNVYYSFYLFII